MENMPKSQPAVPCRANLLATIRDNNGESPLHPPSVRTLRPLSEPSAALARILAARAAAGLSAGSDHPRARQWHRTVIPAAASALTFLAATAIAGWLGPGLAFFTGLGFLVSTVIVVWSSIYVLRDPLRFLLPLRREYEQARSWQSGQPWDASLSAGPQRRLLSAACAAAARIVASPAWAEPSLDEHRLLLNLHDELDAIDRQAHAVASAGRTLPQSVTDALVDRVAALCHYADTLAKIKTEPAELPLHRENEIFAGSVRDEYACGQLAELTAELHGLTNSAVSRTSAG